MAPPTTLGATELRDAMTAYRDLLAAHQEGINRLNVYPVPDGDTGTNMARTLDAVVDELGELGADPSMTEVCAALSHGSLMGARGNSGVILSQLLRGMADRMASTTTTHVTATDLSDALGAASGAARRAVVRPVEGTILSVAAAAAEAAAEATTGAVGNGGGLAAVVECARHGAARALARTPEQLPVLRKAGVVDAGGTGFLLLFDALLVVLDGRAPSSEGLPAPSSGGPPDLRRQGSAPGGPIDSDVLVEDPDPISQLRYEVMYLLEAPDDTVAAFREVWAGIGDSIVIVGGDGLWNCHIHTDDIGASIEAALDAGRPRRIRVTDLLEQVEEERWVQDASASAPVGQPSPDADPPRTAVVAVVSGDGIGRIFRSLGVMVQVRGGQSANPSTADLVAAVEGCGADEVVILPNNRNVGPVADQVDALCAQRVHVVPTESMVEGFASLLAYDPAADVDENARAMASSAQRVVPGEVTRAVRNADTEAGPVAEGDWLGVSRHRVVVAGPTVVAATCGLLEHLVEGHHELLTLIEGEGATAADTRRISEWVHERYPEMTVEVHHGGQALYPYLFGIE